MRLSLESRSTQHFTQSVIIVGRRTTHDHMRRIFPTIAQTRARHVDTGRLAKRRTRAMIAEEQSRRHVQNGLDKQQTWLGRLTANQTFNLLLGFLLTAVIGGALTHYYAKRQTTLQFELTARQKDLDDRRSFADALNRQRVEKIAEVWEKLFFYEAAVDRALDAREQFLTTMTRIAGTIHLEREGDLLPLFNKQQKAEVQRTEESFDHFVLEAERAADTVQQIALKNRFWLGDNRYNEIMSYLNESGAVVNTAGSPHVNMFDLQIKRKRLKVSIAQIRDAIARE